VPGDQPTATPGSRRWYLLAGTAPVLILVAVLSAPSLADLRTYRSAIQTKERQVAAAAVEQAGWNLVAALQTERGRTTLRLSGSSTAASDVRHAREDTDAALATWSQQLTDAEDAGLDLGQSTALTAGLATERQLIDAQVLRAGQPFTWYTESVTHAANTVASAARIIDEPGLGAIASDLGLLILTEQTAQVRGRITELLVTGTPVTDTELSEVAAARSARDTAERFLRWTASPTLLASLETIGESPQADIMSDVEDTILTGEPQTLTALDAEQWFDQASTVVDAYTRLGVDTADTTARTAEQGLDTAVAQERKALIVLSALAAITFLLGITGVAGLLAFIRRRVQDAATVRDRQVLRRETILDGVISSSQALIYVKDLQGRFLLASPSLLRKLGKSEQELIGHDDTVISTEMASVWQKNDLQALDGEILIEEWQDTPGGRFWFQTVKFPLRDENGEVYAVAGTSIDVTDLRRALADAHEARTEAERASAAKSAFLATMSHEIRTPLNAVIGMSDLLLLTDLDDLQREYVDTATTSATALLAIINDILDYSRFEADTVDLRPRPTDLRSSIEEVLVMLAVRAGTVDLIADLDPACPDYVEVDTDRFRQVLINLVGNAVKFTSHGQIVVRVRPIHATEPSTQAAAPSLPITSPDDTPTRTVTLEFSVHDSGIGIAPNVLPKLFQPFVQADESSTRTYGGTGLGLAISQTIIKAMGGHIRAESTPGIGSVFSFHLTLPISEPPATHRAPISPESLTDRRILVVDDNPINRDILQQQITGWGAHVTTTADAATALTALTTGPPYDLAVLDHEMPGTDGITLARRIRADHGTDIVLILLSSRTARPDIDHNADLFDGSLTKPVRHFALRDALTQALTGNQEVDVISPAPATITPTTSPLRILLAEDNLTNQRVTQRMLTVLGHYVDIVENGAQAVTAAIRRDYDLVLMDLHMPELDGIGATRAIREQIPTDRQPSICAMTASSLPEDRQACYDAGMNNFLLKPVRATELAALLTDIPRRTHHRPNSTTAEPPTLSTPPAAVPTPRSTPEPTTPEPLDTPPVDLAILQTLLREAGYEDNDERDEMIGSFLTETALLMTRLEIAVKEQDHATIRAIVHRLDSSSALVGANSLAHHLGQLGATARSPESSSEQLHQAHTAAVTAHTTTQAWFVNHLGYDPSATHAPNPAASQNTSEPGR